ncbi:hypothetical protein CN085_14790 [Sinorhizobium meliloti]|nr:hypothetical protein CN085_14790 [Sinorhizobium meliloti]
MHRLSSPFVGERWISRCIAATRLGGLKVRETCSTSTPINSVQQPSLRSETGFFRSIWTASQISSLGWLVQTVAILPRCRKYTG